MKWIVLSLLSLSLAGCSRYVCGITDETYADDMPQVLNEDKPIHHIMDIKEYRERKKKFYDDMKLLIDDFEKDTGMAVESVSGHKVYAGRDERGSEVYRMHISAIVEI